MLFKRRRVRITKTFLESMVHLFVDDLRNRGGPNAQEWYDALARSTKLEAMAEKAVSLETFKRGEWPEVATELAFIVAVLSFRPGGVSLFGQHWQTRPPGEIPDLH